MSRENGIIRGRGASGNPPNRFERIEYVPDEEMEASAGRPPTLYLRDSSRSIIARNDSPDVGFETSINPYRGCEHGCSYCFARPTHEYLGFSAGLDFETRILVKEDAPRLLRDELGSPKWTPQVIAVSGVTDCYQPIERRLGLTRACLEVLAEFRNPTVVITKNHLVTRDIDVLGELARFGAASVAVSITTLDEGLARVMEPRASAPRLRLQTVEALSAAGIPASVLVAPVIPGLTDHEIASILSAAARAGAVSAGYVMLRLPWAVGPLFERWLEEHVPDRAQKVMNRVREVRNGRTYDTRWGSRLRGEGIFADQIGALFHAALRRTGMEGRPRPLSTAAFRRPDVNQRALFDL